MVENRADRRVGHIVGRNVNRLNRGNVAARSRQDPVLQAPDFGHQRRLIPTVAGMRPSRPEISLPACTKR